MRTPVPAEAKSGPPAAGGQERKREADKVDSKTDRYALSDQAECESSVAGIRVITQSVAAEFKT